MDVEFQWQTEDKKHMATLKEASCHAPVLKAFNVSDCAREIVVRIDARI